MKKHYTVALSITLAIILAVLVITPSADAAVVIANENFEDRNTTGWVVEDGVGWNELNYSTIGGDNIDGSSCFSTFLGRFLGTGGRQAVYKTFELSGEQTEVTVNFSFYHIDAWIDEIFYIYINDELVRRDIYNRHDRHAPPGTTVVVGSEGMPVKAFQHVWDDQGIGYSFTIATTDTNIKIGFGTNLTNETLYSQYYLDIVNGDLCKAWGIDDVYIIDNYEEPVIPDEPDPMDVLVDIKPGGCPTPLNVTDQGNLPIAILGTEYFDVAEINILSVRLIGIIPLHSSIEDVSEPLNIEICAEYGLEDYDYEQIDGYDDLTLKFDNQSIVAVIGEIADGDIVELTLTGELRDGTKIEGSNIVLIIKD